MKRSGIPTTLALAALLLAGCTVDLDETTSTRGPSAARTAPDNGAAPLDNRFAVPGEEPQDLADDEDWWNDNDSLSLDILDARLQGSIGPVAQLAHSASETTSFADGYWTTVSVTVDKGDGNGAAMTILDMEGDLRTLEPGIYHLDFVEGAEWIDEEPQAVQAMYIIGCSGDDPGEWSYDQPADEAEIEVTHDNDVVQIDFTADFSEGTVYDWETGDATAVGRSSVTGHISIRR